MRLHHVVIVILCILPLRHGRALKYRVNPDNVQYVTQNYAGQADAPRVGTPTAANQQPVIATRNDEARDSNQKSNKWLEPIVIINFLYVIITYLMLRAIKAQGEQIERQIGVADNLGKWTAEGADSMRRQWRATHEQDLTLKQHLEQLVRSSEAMEKVVSVINFGNHAALRAYLSVVIGTGFYQERSKGIKFEGRPNLVNTGSTPARNVRVRITAAIVTAQQAETFTYPLPDEAPKAQAPSVAAPHQSYVLNAILEDFVPETDVLDIKQGIGNRGALTVWGIVTYEDIFGGHHVTKFGQWLFWHTDLNQTMYGLYIPGQNDMD